MPDKETLLSRNMFTYDKKSLVILGYNTVNIKQCDEYAQCLNYIIRKV